MTQKDSAFPDDLDENDQPSDTEAVVICPWCGETVEIALDLGSGPVQDYVEDCQVCCRPWRVMVTYHDGHAEVVLEADE
jgi:hypothetical protein